MTGADWVVLSAVVGVVVAIAGVIINVRDRATKQAEVERNRLAATFKAGADSRNDEVRLLTSQRDDARHDRDVAQARADEYERRYNNLRERGRG